MEELGLRALHRRVAGIDVHRMLHVVTVLIEQPDGTMHRQVRKFGGFRRDLAATGSVNPASFRASYCLSVFGERSTWTLVHCLSRRAIDISAGH